jgi:UrcA family protein
MPRVIRRVVVTFPATQPWSMKMRRLHFIVVSLALAVATPAMAGTARAEPARVQFGDLNLGSPAGADAFLARVNLAARAYCGARTGPVSIREHQRVRACRLAFQQEAVADLSNGAVASRFIERGGRLRDVAVAAR